MLVKNEKQTIYFISSDISEFSPVLTKATGKEEFCITASTLKDKVSVKNFYPQEIETDDLLKIIPESIAVLLITESGGLYYTPDMLKSL